MVKLDRGKLNIDLLEKLINLKGKKRKAVIVGPKIGSDAAVLNFNQLEKEAQEYYNDFSEARLIVKTDPITFNTPEPGKYAVIVNSNDIAMTGAIPVALNVTIILPLEFPYEELVKRNIISKRLELREAEINGNPVPRKCNWITINTNTKHNLGF